MIKSQNHNILQFLAEDLIKTQIWIELTLATTQYSQYFVGEIVLHSWTVTVNERRTQLSGDSVDGLSFLHELV